MSTHRRDKSFQMEGFDSRLGSARSILWISVLLFLWGQVLPWKTTHQSPERVTPTWTVWQDVVGILVDVAKGVIDGNMPKISEVILCVSFLGTVGLFLATPILANVFSRNRMLQVLSALLSLVILAVLILITARPTSALTMGPGFWLIVASYVVNLIGLVVIPHWRVRF